MAKTQDSVPAKADEPLPVAMVSGMDDRSIHQRMIDVLAELPAIGKDSRNEQQKFMYRSHDDVLNALNPLLAKHGIYVVPTVLERVAENRSTSKGSTMYEVNLLVRYRFYGAQGDHIEASAWGEGTDMGDKSTNKAMTMAFKNVLAQAFAVSTAETQDSDSGSPEETTREPARQESAGTGSKAAKSWPELTDRLATVLGFADDGPEWIREAVQERFGKTTSELTKEQRREVLQRASGALLDLEDEFAGAFPPPSRERVAQAFAKTWEGIALHGPPWRVGADDPESIPDYDVWKKQQENEAAEREAAASEGAPS